MYVCVGMPVSIGVLSACVAAGTYHSEGGSTSVGVCV